MMILAILFLIEQPYMLSQGQKAQLEYICNWFLYPSRKAVIMSHVQYNYYKSGVITSYMHFMAIPIDKVCTIEAL